ncbi:uncharacterized protein E5676_scaffold208G00490 [Cucumis melo var. makuwa]|uniref:Ubiquitin-like protease family profile domain-containing protein n=1 Tax=Cucumis melo var. makuwa TaxID=1194695 RepID=A0A5D3E2J4_CUCMM|nr:uncharacterized protein E5676_scaffold208G00490 [Cucumis melo var. makuwa]
MNTDSSSVNRHYSNDVLTQALGTKEHNGHVCGVGGYVTPTTYFHSVKKTSKDEANILVENEELCRRVSELEAQIRSNLSTPLSTHGSCSRPIVLEGIEEKGKRIEVELLDKPKQKEKKGKEVMKMNEPKLDVLKERDLIKMPTEKEVVCESTSTLPLALKLILRYAEKVMEKDSNITFSLPADLFGISQKTSMLREDIVDLCNMNEVKTFTLVAYMMYLYSSVSGSKENMQYVFVDPSLISSGNIQESRIRNLCSRLMVSKSDQVILAPFNPGGHWALLTINAYEDTVLYLDSLRTTSKATTRYVTDTLFVILAGSKYHFTPEITSCSLIPTDPLLNNWFKVQPINLNPFRSNEKVEPLVQDLDSVLKRTTYLLSEKWVRVNSVLHPMSLAIHSVLSLKWEAYCANNDELPSPMQI